GVDRRKRRCRVERGHFILGQRYGEAAQIVVELVRLAGAENDARDRRFRQQPGERDLRDARSVPRRDLPHPLHELEALLLVEGKEVEPGIAVVRARQGLELATGRLERVLEPFLPTTPGFFLYFP